MRSWHLAEQLGTREEHVRRWLIRMDRWKFSGLGGRVDLTHADARAVAVAVAIAVAGEGSEGRFEVTNRAVLAGQCAADHLTAAYIVATPRTATAHDDAEAALTAWRAAGCPVAAIVPVAAVLTPLTAPAGVR